MVSTTPSPPSPRSTRKRQAILAEATALFLRNGFRGTSMDEVATAAGVSKQTVYKQFRDKEQLFRDIVRGVSQNSDAIVADLTSAFGAGRASTREDLRSRLVAVARVYLDRVLQPQVLSLRRLIIAEAERFPDLARDYYDRGPARGIDVLTTCLEPYLDSGLLVTDDLRTAAAQLAYLSLAVAQDRALFLPGDLPTDQDRDRLAAAAASTFLASHGRREDSPR